MKQTNKRQKAKEKAHEIHRHSGTHKKYIRNHNTYSKYQRGKEKQKNKNDAQTNYYETYNLQECHWVYFVQAIYRWELDVSLRVTFIPGNTLSEKTSFSFVYEWWDGLEKKKKRPLL